MIHEWCSGSKSNSETRTQPTLSSESTSTSSPTRLPNEQVRVGRAAELENQLQQTSLKLKQAENFTAAALRKQRKAEAELVDAEARIEELERRVSSLQERADLLAELEIKIADAKSAKDLL